MLNPNKLVKKYKIKPKEVLFNLSLAEKEAEKMGKADNDRYVEKIFQILIGYKESSSHIPEYKKMFNETIISTDIPQDLKPETFVGTEEERKRAERLKKSLHIKSK